MRASICARTCPSFTEELSNASSIPVTTSWSVGGCCSIASAAVRYAIIDSGDVSCVIMMSSPVTVGRGLLGSCGGGIVAILSFPDPSLLIVGSYPFFTSSPSLNPSSSVSGLNTSVFHLHSSLSFRPSLSLSSCGFPSACVGSYPFLTSSPSLNPSPSVSAMVSSVR